MSGIGSSHIIVVTVERLRAGLFKREIGKSPSSQGGDDASLVSKILDPLASAHYKLPLQKQWQTLVQGRHQLSFVRDPSEGEQITSKRDGLLLPPGRHFNSGNRFLRG